MRKIQILAVTSVAIGMSLWTLAQSPTPAVVPTPIPTATPTPQEPDFSNTIKVLEQMETTNEETLKKQQAAVELLDRLQKDAEELRIFAKRG